MHGISIRRSKKKKQIKKTPSPHFSQPEKQAKVIWLKATFLIQVKSCGLCFVCCRVCTQPINWKPTNERMNGKSQYTIQHAVCIQVKMKVNRLIGVGHSIER